MATKIQVRRDTTANWTTYENNQRAAGECCYDIYTKTLRIGDGASAYKDLPDIIDASFEI